MALFVHDTFTGPLGLLTAHTGEIGATWSLPPWGPVSSQGFGEMRLTGGGSIELRYEGTAHNSEEAIASGTPPGLDYFVEVTFTAPPPFAGEVNELTLTMRASSAGYVEAAIRPAQNTAHPGSGYWLYNSSNDTYDDSPLGPPYIGTHTFRAEVEGATARYYIDGLLLGSLPVDALVAGSVGFAFAAAGPSTTTGMVINEFRAGTLGAESPASFWTAFKSATESLS